MKNIIIILLVLTGLIKSSLACWIDDKRTLTEFLFQGKIGTVFTCKVLTTARNKNEDIISTAQIVEVYFGKVDSSIISLNTGNDNSSTGGTYLVPGKTFLIYSRGNGNNFDSHRRLLYIPDIPDSNYDVKTIKQFAEIINQKRTGNYIFKNSKGIIIAKGRYKKGVAVGLWQHFNDHGVIKAQYDLKHNITSEFDESGTLKTRQTSRGNINIYERYSSETKGLLEYKEIDTIKSISLTINTFYEYYPNGGIKKIHGQYDRKGSGGFTNTYEEYFENGKLHLHGQYYNNKKVGLWKWFNEDGSFLKEYDYKDGTNTTEK